MDARQQCRCRQKDSLADQSMVGTITPLYKRESIALEIRRDVMNLNRVAEGSDDARRQVSL